MAKKTTWIEKRDNPSGDVPKVVRVEGKMAGRWGASEGATCAIPAPKDIDEFLRKIPEGKIATINSIREMAAKKYKTEIGCPITSGIFSWIVANAAEEEREAGKKDITPWWRLLKGEGFLNEKYPGYPTLQKAALESEGHKIITRGKRLQVAEWENSLAKV